jgi:mRNA-degrading endonuclease toxin of MazEF toxin-antitoxin module
MPLDAFLDVYADLVGRTVIRPSTLPQAQINFKMKTPLTKRELVQALEGVLMVNQITIIPSGRSS